MMTGQQPKAPPEFYKDTAVIAYRVPAADVPMRDLHPTVTSSGGQHRSRRCSTDGDLVKFAVAADGAGRSEGLDPVRVPEAAWRFAVCRSRSPGIEMAVRPAAATDRTSRRATTGRRSGRSRTFPRSTAEQNTVSFPPVEARFFRVAFVTPPPATCRSTSTFRCPTATDRVPDRGARAAHRRAREPIRREGGVRAARRALGSADAGGRASRCACARARSST